MRSTAIENDHIAMHKGAAVRSGGLLDHGHVEVQGSPSWAGLPWSVSRLTEAGMSVAFGLTLVLPAPDFYNICVRVTGAST